VDIAVRTSWRSQQFCALVSPRPAFAYLCSDIAALQAEMEEGGYYRPHPQQERGQWAVLFYNFELAPIFEFAIGQGTDDEMARSSAANALAHCDSTFARNQEAAAAHDEARAAIRDVVSWNTAWDEANSLCYTTLSRNWTKAKFGGWGIWLNDVLYAALLAAYAGDWETTENNVAAALKGLQPAGNLACLLSAYTEWVDRSQPPIGGYVIWRIYLLTRDRALLARWYPTLLRAHDWWYACRDGNRNGLLEHGSSPTGEGAFRHTKLAALNESAMDNLPIFDAAHFVSRAHTIDFEEIGLNSLLVLDGEMLARVAQELGFDADAQRLHRRTSQHAERIRQQMWDPVRRLFVGRHWSGQLSDRISPTSFFPLVAGIATREQAQALVHEHLLNPREFWGERPLPSTPYDDTASQDNVYWRGRVWPPLNYFTWEGLRRYAFESEAAALVERSWQLFAEEWKTVRHCHENYHLYEPAGNDGPDSDSFYTWGALMPLMRLLEQADVSPWDGLSLSAVAGRPAELRSPGAAYRLEETDRVAMLTKNGVPVLQVVGARRLRHLVVEDYRIGATPSGEDNRGYTFQLLGPGSDHVVAITVDGRMIESDKETNRVILERLAAGTRVEIYLGETPRVARTSDVDEHRT
jgi:putative isomerase